MTNYLLKGPENDDMPTVSVIIPSYNHENFIEECIQSVLDQTFQDFEIIITDDASSDRTVEIIESFDDARISLYKHEKNRGASVAANNCILRSHGRYIAMLSSDDAWYPQKLDLQVKFLDEHPETAAVFGRVDWIDETGQIITNKSFRYLDVFNVENRTRFEWLRHFFDKGNCLCHPTSLIRRECYDEIGLLNPMFSNIPDFDLWIRICLRYEIKILDQKLIRFRRMNSESNASGDTNKNRPRMRYEFKQALNHYLKLTEPNEFLLVFPEADRYGRLTTDEIPYVLSNIAIDSGSDFKVLWGMDIIYTLLQDVATARMIEERFGFTYRDFITITGEHDIFKVLLNPPSPTVLPPVAQQKSFRTFLSTSKKYVTAIYSILSRILRR